MATGDVPWLEEYSGQTTDELLALEGRYRTDSLVVAFDQALAQKAFRVGVESLTDEERMILAVEAFENQVNNGGYHQFFGNSSREYASVIVNALREIGCPVTAGITERALEVLGRMPMSESELANLSWEQNRDRSAALEECDQAFFESREQIDELLFAFIRSRRDRVSLGP